MNILELKRRARGFMAMMPGGGGDDAATPAQSAALALEEAKKNTYDKVIQQYSGGKNGEMQWVANPYYKPPSTIAQKLIEAGADPTLANKVTGYVNPGQIQLGATPNGVNSAEYQAAINSIPHREGQNFVLGNDAYDDRGTPHGDGGKGYVGATTGGWRTPSHGGGDFFSGLGDALGNIVGGVSDSVSGLGKEVAKSPLAQAAISAGAATMGVPPSVTAALLGANSAGQKGDLGAGVATGLGSLATGSVVNSPTFAGILGQVSNAVPALKPLAAVVNLGSSVTNVTSALEKGVPLSTIATNIGTGIVQKNLTNDAIRALSPQGTNPASEYASSTPGLTQGMVNQAAATPRPQMGAGVPVKNAQGQVGTMDASGNFIPEQPMSTNQSTMASADPNAGSSMFDTLGNVLGTGASAIGSALNGTSNSQLMGLLGTLYSGDKAADATQKAAGQLSQGYTDQGNTIAKGAMDAANTAATGITQGAGTTAAGYNQSGTTAANGITQGANTTAGGITQGSNTMASGITQGADTTATGITQGAGTMASGITQGAGTIAGGYDKSTDIYHNQLDPYAAAGGPALASLEAGTAAGGQFNKPFTMADATNSEAERVARERGLDAIQNSAAYKGGLISSNDMQGLNKFAADTAAQYENQAFNQDLATKQNNYSNLNNLVGIGDNASRALASATGANAVGAGNAIGTGQINSAGVLGQGEINAAGVRGTAQTNAAGVQGKGQIESAGVLGKGQSDAAATLANSQLGAAKTTGAGQTNAAETMAKGQSGAATALGNAQASAAGANASGTMGAANAQTAMVDSAIKAYTALGGAKDAAGNPTNLAALQKALGQAGITIPQNVLSQGLTSVGDWLRNISNPTQASTSTNQTGGYQDPNLTNHLDPSVTPYPMYSDTAYAGDLRPNQPTFDISNQDTPTTTADLSMYDYGGSMN